MKLLSLLFLTTSIDPLTFVYIGGVVVLLLIAIILTYFILKKKKKRVCQDSEIWLIALGGKDNLEEAKGIGSRLSVKLMDKERIDRDKLKELGVSNVIIMADKITLVIEGQAENIAKIINRDL